MGKFSKLHLKEPNISSAQQSIVTHFHYKENCICSQPSTLLSDLPLPDNFLFPKVKYPLTHYQPKLFKSIFFNY